MVHPDLPQGKASNRILEGFCAAEKNTLILWVENSELFIKGLTFGTLGCSHKYPLGLSKTFGFTHT